MDKCLLNNNKIKEIRLTCCSIQAVHFLSLGSVRDGIIFLIRKIRHQNSDSSSWNKKKSICIWQNLLNYIICSASFLVILTAEFLIVHLQLRVYYPIFPNFSTISDFSIMNYKVYKAVKKWEFTFQSFIVYLKMKVLNITPKTLFNPKLNCVWMIIVNRLKLGWTEGI